MDDFYVRRDTSILVPWLFRIVVVFAFLAIIVRLYQLQVLQSDSYQQRAESNRSKVVETLAPRGVVYDSNGEILVRNKARFQVEIIPDLVVYDDDATDDVDEEIEAIRSVLEVLNAKENEQITVRIAEAMLRRLGRCDYVIALEKVGITPRMIRVPAPAGSSAPAPCDTEAAKAETALAEATDYGGEEELFVEIPDTDNPLPLAGLEALVQKAVSIQRLGQASVPIPLLIVEQAVAFDVMEASFQLPSVRVAEVPIRSYIFGDLVSHVIGFMGAIPASVAREYRDEGYNNLNERIGVSGIEYSYQKELRGIPGKHLVEVDILGREVGELGSVQEPVPGQNVYLTIDLDLQRTMHTELQSMMMEKEAVWGVTIAMDPMTGAVLGLVSLPSFDNSIFSGELNEEYNDVIRDERRPLINYAISSLYPPGSVFKLVVAAAALQEEIVSPATLITDDGPIYLPNRFAPDDLSLAQKFVSWNHAPTVNVNHGPLNMARAIAWSNDIYFYLIGGGFPKTRNTPKFYGLEEDRLVLWSRQFGYGGPTGIDLPGETGGLIPTNAWKRRRFAQNWTTGDSYNMSIGQGYVGVTPLQVLVATSAVINGGKVLKPQLVDKITDVNGVLQNTFKPVVACDVTVGCADSEQFMNGLTISPEYLEVVRTGMWEAVNTQYGTSIAARINGYIAAGKTGTAEFCETKLDDCGRNEIGYLPTHSWYVGYAPYDEPQIAVVTFIFNGGEGSDAALPVTRRIMEAYFGVLPEGELAQSE